MVAQGGPPARAQSGGCSPNPIACENAKPGDPAEDWDVPVGDETIQGFTTEFSVNRGSAVHFKISTDASAYSIEIYRIGYYGGMGARKVATIAPSATLPQVQPDCLNDLATGLIDCGNWQESAMWQVPADATSGLYVGKMTRSDTDRASHVYFVVRDDSAHSSIVYQTSDTTWQAYNSYGGNSLYRGDPVGRAYKVSYNRPFNTREIDIRDAPFYAEYPMIRWLESNGYDVSYISGGDTDRRGALLQQHQVFLTSGHDEYWSGAQRTNVEAARAAGVNLAFFSGNDVFWKTRWEPSIDATATPYRTLVTYKETHAGEKIDPESTWTGTWRDARFSPPFDGGRPENALTGTIFTVNCCTGTITVPADNSRLRFWRHTDVASLQPGEVATLAPSTLGYEWNEDLDNGFRPQGLVRMSSTTMDVPERIVDNGSVYAPGTATHALTLYRHSSGSLVFSSGTVQWSWGLDALHDSATEAPADRRMQQATVNLLMDMGVPPATPMPDLDTTPMPPDVNAPHTTIVSPAFGADVAPNAVTQIAGTAFDAAGSVGAVEVSLDGGAHWRVAVGRENWSYSWTPTAVGPATIMVRAIDDSGNIESPAASLTLDVTNPTCPCTIWSPSTAVPSGIDVSDDSPVELGVKFRSSLSGFITGVRFYKSAVNTGAHVGSLWTSAGTLLGSALFTNESTSGWQQVTFTTPVPVVANAIYVASYHTNSGHYSASGGYFTTGVDTPPLHAVANVTSPNGVYGYGETTTFPTGSYNASNYWVDVVYSTTAPVDTAAPIVKSTVPAAGAVAVATGTSLKVGFSEAVNISTLTTTTLDLRTSAGVPVSGTLTYDAATQTVTLAPSTPLAVSTTYLARVRGGSTDPRVKDVAGNALASDVTWSFTTAAPAVCPCSIWNPAVTVPQIADSGDGSAVELGLKFKSQIGGFISGLRFYKSGANIGTHTGSLWTSTGTLLARATFINETSSGWQQVLFAAPVNVTAETMYVVSYHTDSGHYAVDRGYFTSAVDSPPLLAFANATSPNGVFAYGNNAFPSSSYDATNYWVDPIFTNGAGAGDSTPPAVLSSDPMSGATGVDAGVKPVVRFSEAMNASTISTSTIELHDPADAIVSGSVTYDASTFVTTFAPANALMAGGTYRLVAKGGSASPRVTDVAGNALPANFSSSFTVSAVASCPCSFWNPATTVPSQPDAFDGSAVELGVKFRADVDGVITGVRFYKSAANTGPHVGNLWTAAGTLLGTANFAGETASGWQEVTFATPIAVTANTNYVASYHTTSGHYAATGAFFANAGAGTAPLHALGNASSPNGVYQYGSGGFPVLSYNATNYWVDVVFDTSAPSGGDPIVSTGFVDTTAADFGRGTTDTGGYVSQAGDGEVTLAPLAGSEFDGTALPAGWSADSWGGAATVALTGGTLIVDGARVSTTALFSADRSIEFSATFSGAPYEHVGFGVTLNETPWAIFSSGPGDSMYVRTNNGAMAIDTALAGSWFGAAHRFRIDWSPTTVSYWIDGVRVAVHAVAIGGTMRPIASDFAGDGVPLRVDWLRVTPYASASTYSSAVLDAGSAVTWQTAQWTGTTPAGTSVVLSVRTGNTPVPDGNWTPFVPVTTGALTGITRYAQYRLELATSDPQVAPAVGNVTLTFVR